MKSTVKILNAFTVLILCSMQATHANDLYVEIHGAGGAYTTISAAVTAASAGDVIHIFPLANGDAYNEAVVINKKLQLVSAQQNVPFKVTGTISIISSLNSNATGSFLNACQVNGNVVINNCTGIHIANTTINGNVTGNSASETFIDASSVTGCITIARGRVSGCNVVNTGSLPAISLVASSLITTDTTFVVGNNISATDTLVPTGIQCNTGTQLVFAANNNIALNYTGHAQYGGYGFYAASTKNVTGFNSAFLNNTVSSFGGGKITSGVYCIFSAGKFIIENNLVQAICNNGYNYYFAGTTGTASVCRFNYSTSGFYGVSTTANVSNYNAQYDIPTKIDAGDMDMSFTDLDLTRNDVGITGGSYSSANFLHAAYNAHVLFVNVPRVVMVNQPFNINADAVTY